MRISSKRKHSRLYTREQHLRHRAKVKRLARLYRMREPWAGIWVQKAHHKYARWEWQNEERQGYSVQEVKLDQRDKEDTNADL